MNLFLVVEISIILAGFITAFGHIGLANKFLIGTFILIFFAVLDYVIRLLNNDKE